MNSSLCSGPFDSVRLKENAIGRFFRMDKGTKTAGEEVWT